MALLEQRVCGNDWVSQSCDPDQLLMVLRCIRILSRDTQLRVRILMMFLVYVKYYHYSSVTLVISMSYPT